MSLACFPQPHRTLSATSIALLRSNGQDPVILGNPNSYALITLHSALLQTPHYRRTIIPSNLESVDVLTCIFGMDRECGREVWGEYIAYRRMQFRNAAILRREMETLDEVCQGVIAAEGEGKDTDAEKITEVQGSKAKAMGYSNVKKPKPQTSLKEFILAVWIPKILEKYGDPNGMDENAKEEYRKCMIGAGLTNQTLLRHWTEEAWPHLMQLGTFGQWIKWYWVEIWERLEDIDGKVQRGQVIDF